VAAHFDVLVVAAFAPELDGFEEALRGAATGDVAARRGVLARPVGIGLVEAACGATRELAAERPRAVVMMGTCGSYAGSALSVGDVVVGRCARLVEPAVVLGQAAFPDPVPVRIEAHAAMTAAFAAAGARAVDIATTLAVTTDDGLAARLATCGAVEHLEAFAVATACQARGVPFAAVLAVANSVGSSGRAEWRAHHAVAGRAACDHVARWILAGAPGLPG
jgi:nucleoside phosphorylase